MSRWKKALRLETAVARIIHQQELNGVVFDMKKAEAGVQDLQGKQDALYSEIRPYLSLEVENRFTVEVKKPWVKSGDFSSAVLQWYKEHPPDIVGPFSRVEFVEPDIGSRQKLTKQLLAVGWKPDLFTDKGTPKLTDKGEPVKSLERIDAPVGKQLAMWYVLGHRKSQIQGWIKRIRLDGRLTAGANSCGTNTARMRHSIVVNVPKADAKVLYGYEMRDLFTVPKGHLMVGHDASGLEARVMGHYTTPLDGGIFADEILNGDIHTKNAFAFFPTQLRGMTKEDDGFSYYRNLAKTLFYGLIYGAQVGKVRSIVGCSQKEAKRIFEAFWGINPGLGRLRDKIIAISDKNGWVPGLDGRRIYTRSSHSAMNAVFQSGGAIIMKVSMVILSHWAEQARLSVAKVIDMHDESEAEVPICDIDLRRGTSDELDMMQEEYRDRILTPVMHRRDGTCERGWSLYGEMAVKSIRMSGKSLDLRCELDAEYMIGRSWAEVH